MHFADMDGDGEVQGGVDKTMERKNGGGKRRETAVVGRDRNVRCKDGIRASEEVGKTYKGSDCASDGAGDPPKCGA